MLDIFGESSEGPKKAPTSNNLEDYASCAAMIPECQSNSDPCEEYKDFPEERIWSPMSEIRECWMPLFMFMARSALTCAQERQGIANKEAMENSCNGYAEQYISKVLHDSGYIPEVALRRLMAKELPNKLYDRWTDEEMVLFGKGLTRYGKEFTVIKEKLLPQKTTMELVEFYYTWKRSKEAKGLVASRARRFLRCRTKSVNLIIGSPTAAGVLTRGRLAAEETSVKTTENLSTSNKQVSKGVKRKRRVVRQSRLCTIKV